MDPRQRSIRNQARSLLALAQASSDDELARWRRDRGGDDSLSADVVRSTRDLLVALCDMIDPNHGSPEHRARMRDRVAGALAFLQVDVTTGGATSADVPKEVVIVSTKLSIDPSLPALPARVDAAPISLEALRNAPPAPPPDVAAAPVEPVEAPISKPSPWAGLAPSARRLEPELALGATENAVAPAPGPALPFVPASNDTPPPARAVSLEPSPSMGATVDAAPGAEKRPALPFRIDPNTASAAESLEHYTWLCARTPPGSSRAETSGNPQLDLVWSQRFKADLQLLRAFRKLLVEYRQWIGQRGGA